MPSVFYQSLSPCFHKGWTRVFAFIWCLGLMLGLLLFIYAGASYSSLMRGILFDTVSIVRLLLFTTLPFLLSAFAVYLSQPWLLLLIGFFKAFLFSFVSIGIILSFGSAGWLLRLLLMFNDFVSVSLLYRYIYRHLHVDSRFSAAEILAVLSVCILIGSVDYGYILPFLADMINT